MNVETGLTTLYQITQAIADIDNLMSEPEAWGDELTEEAREEYLGDIEIALGNAIAAKLPGLIGYDKWMTRTQENIKAREYEIRDLRKSLEKRQERYHQYITDALNRAGIRKLETDAGSISICKNPASVDTRDLSTVPPEYRTVTMTVKGHRDLLEWLIKYYAAHDPSVTTTIEETLDKAAAKAAIKETGEVIMGVDYITDKTHLSFK